MERLFRSVKTEWVPGLGYDSESEAKRDLSFYLMDYYNWARPHTFNEGVLPAKAENLSKPLDFVDHYTPFFNEVNHGTLKTT